MEEERQRQMVCVERGSIQTYELVKAESKLNSLTIAVTADSSALGGGRQV